MRRRWSAEDARHWLQALALPAVPWLAPVFPQLGLPIALAGRSAILSSIHDQARGEQASPEDPGAIERTVATSMERLAQTTSIQDARTFERWARRHFLCLDVPTSLYSWRQVLRRAIVPEGGLYARVAPPPMLSSLLPQIAHVLSDDRLAGLEQQLQQVAPQPDVADRELGLRLPAAALTALEIGRNETTSEALRLIANTLSAEDRERIAEWGAKQAEALDMPPDRLGGATLLQSEPPCLNGPPEVGLNT